MLSDQISEIEINQKYLNDDKMNKNKSELVTPSSWIDEHVNENTTALIVICILIGVILVCMKALLCYRIFKNWNKPLIFEG